jgi:hypothetical protein
MTVPSGMYRVCRTNRSLNVVTFTIEASVRQKKEAGAAPEGAAPAVKNPKNGSGYDTHRPKAPRGRWPAHCLAA